MAHGPYSEMPYAKQNWLQAGRFYFFMGPGLRSAFPEEAHEFEPGMHGGLMKIQKRNSKYTDSRGTDCVPLA